jgi:hypothetical protein
VVFAKYAKYGSPSQDVSSLSLFTAYDLEIFSALSIGYFSYIAEALVIVLEHWGLGLITNYEHKKYMKIFFGLIISCFRHN